MTAELTTTPQSRPASNAAPRRHTVLIIDDDHTLAEVLSHGLKQQGFRAVAAHSGAAGLRKAKAEPPSAIILDLGLPDADGLTVCSQLADSPETLRRPDHHTEWDGTARHRAPLPGGRLPLLPAKAPRPQRLARPASAGHLRHERLGQRRLSG